MTKRVAVAVPEPDCTTLPVRSETSNLNGPDSVSLLNVTTERVVTEPAGAPLASKKKTLNATAKGAGATCLQDPRPVVPGWSLSVSMTLPLLVKTSIAGNVGWPATV